MEISKSDQELYCKTVEAIEKGIWSGIKRNCPPQMKSDDQLGCTIVALSSVIKGVAQIMTRGTGELHTPAQVIKILHDMTRL